jgi:uncharacterized repeat protein (TIGR03803 family)
MTERSVKSRGGNSLVWLAGLLVAFIGLKWSPSAYAQTFRVLHTFNGNGDGRCYGGLAIDESTLYGTTNLGETIFSVGTDGTNFSTLYTFGSNGDNHAAGLPNGSLVVSGNTLYGTTFGGGSKGGGVVYRIGEDGTGYTDLHSFNYTTASGTGDEPFGGLTRVGSTLYGTTFSGGNGYNSGTIFTLGVDGNNFRNLYYFAGYGEQPAGNLAFDGSALYGTTVYAGSNGYGIVYRFGLGDSNFNYLHSFAGGSNDGIQPWAGVVISGSTVYGTTYQGGSNNLPGYGTVFRMGVDGSNFTLLHSFGINGDGANPLSGLILNGETLYGMTTNGGDANDGTIFEIGTDGNGYRVLHSFSGSDGGNPQGELTFDGSTLYGATFGGGNGNGTVFALTVPEPSSIALFGMGAIGLVAYARRRRSR